MTATILVPVMKGGWSTLGLLTDAWHDLAGRCGCLGELWCLDRISLFSIWNISVLVVPHTAPVPKKTTIPCEAQTQSSRNGTMTEIRWTECTPRCPYFEFLAAIQRHLNECKKAAVHNGLSGLVEIIEPQWPNTFVLVSWNWAEKTWHIYIHTCISYASPCPST